MKPWLSGPTELLEHALDHLHARSPFDCRIALISIDNAVELSIKTYLGLPRRARGSDGPSRRELQSASSSFPDLLDLLESYAAERIGEVQLGDVEWYHRLRNALYHDGNGITVDADKVETYFQVASTLVEALFDEKVLADAVSTPEASVGNIVLRWRVVEHNARLLASRLRPAEGDRRRILRQEMQWLREEGYIDPGLYERFERLRVIRNEIVHSTSLPTARELEDVDRDVRSLSDALASLCAPGGPGWVDN